MKFIIFLVTPYIAHTHCIRSNWQLEFILFFIIILISAKNLVHCVLGLAIRIGLLPAPRYETDYQKHHVQRYEWFDGCEKKLCVLYS